MTLYQQMFSIVNEKTMFNQKYDYSNVRLRKRNKTCFISFVCYDKFAEIYANKGKIYHLI